MNVNPLLPGCRAAAVACVLALASSACGPGRGSGSTSSAGDDGLTRRERAAHAEAVLRETNFYRDGRGMIFPTSFAKVEKTKAWRLVEPLLKQAGFILDDDRVVGAFGEEHRDAAVIAMGCVACHAGKAAGRLYIGLGNKNVDVGRAGELGRPLITALKAMDHVLPIDGVSETTANAESFFKLLARPGVANHTQGLVPTTAIADWFFRVQGVSTPAKYKSGLVKVPSWWGYGKKRMVGQFADGFGRGDPPGWGLAVELTAGQTPDNIRDMLDEVEIAEELIGDLLPPAYPFAIDQVLAASGKAVFNDTCSRCHGTYEDDAEGLPVYKEPRHIPVGVVGTDPNRALNVDDELRGMISLSPLSDILQGNDITTPGYFSPRLHGVWARFPYLHNGSVPNLASLLSAPQERPAVFSLENAGEEARFDGERGGLTVPAPGSKEARRLEAAARRGARWVYDTRRPESSSQGHPFGTQLPVSDRNAVLEYLKTL